MLKTTAAALLLGALIALPLSASASPLAPESRPGLSNIVPVQGYRERCYRLRERIRDLEERLAYAPYWERERIRRRIWERRREWRYECRY